MDKHKALIMGKRERKIYKFGIKDISTFGRFFNAEPELYETREFIEYDEYYKCDIDNPPLEIGEKIYIDTLEEVLTVKDKARNTNGGYVYWTDCVIETIEDEITQKTKTEAENEQKEYIKQKEEDLKREIKELEQKVEDYEEKLKVIEKTKKWYQFWR